jgi:hypothetical protein
MAVATGDTFGLRIYRSLVLLPSSANRAGAHIRIGYCTPYTNLPIVQKNTGDSTLKQSKNNRLETFKVTVTVFIKHLFFLAPNYNFLFYNEGPFAHVTYWCFFFQIYFTSFISFSLALTSLHSFK